MFCNFTLTFELAKYGPNPVQNKIYFLDKNTVWLELSHTRGRIEQFVAVLMRPPRPQMLSPESSSTPW